MKFPDTVYARVTDSETKLPVANVALVLTLKASRKNDYDIGPKITDQDGRVEFTRKDCERAIETNQKMFVMDYSGDLASCQRTATIRLHEPAQIAGMIRQLESVPEFWGMGFSDPARLIDELRHVRNSDFNPIQILVDEDQLSRDSQVEIHLTRK